MNRQPTTTSMRAFEDALRDFKRATSRLSRIWTSDPWLADVVGDTYPKYLPSFDEFNCDVVEMEIRPPMPELPELPAVGSIVRARYALDGGGHFIWPEGWTGEVVNVPTDGEGDTVEIRAHRYLGPGAHEWDNCRVISLDDAYTAFENEYGFVPEPKYVDRDKLMAFAVRQEFEVVS